MDYKEYRNEIPLNTVKEWSQTLLDSADWKHIGRTGAAREPLRHWAAYPPMNGLIEQIWSAMNESLLEDGFYLKPERVIMNLYNHGDSSWLHVDSQNDNDYTVIIFINDFWDINWGGDFILARNNEILASFAATPGKFVVFKSNIMHGARPISREAPYPRFGVAFQCKHDSDISKLCKLKISTLHSAL